MMKSKLLAVLIVLIAAGTASAAMTPFTVDFGGFPAGTSFGLNPDGSNAFNWGPLAISYFGGTGSIGASIDNTGISGDENGTLQFRFSYPTVALNVAFGSVAGTSTGVQTQVCEVTDPGCAAPILGDTATSPFVYGTYPGSPATPFNYVDLFFYGGTADPNSGIALFQVDSITFTSDVPEPGTIFLLSAGLLSLGVKRLLKSRA